MLTCDKCSHGGAGGAMQASAHDCAECGHSTYSAMQLCQACSLTLDQCQFCREPLSLDLDAAVIESVGELVRSLKEDLEEIEAEYDALIAPHKADIETFLAERNAIYAVYQAAMTEHNEVVIRPGGGSSLQPKSPESASALEAARDKQLADITALDAEYAYVKSLHEFASARKRNNTWRAERIFDIEIEGIIMIALIPRQIQAQLDQVEENWKRNSDRIVDPRAATDKGVSGEAECEEDGNSQ